MRLGAQISTAGGLFKAFERGQDVGCDTVMIFTKSNRQWKAKPLSEDDIRKFRAEDAEYSSIFPVAVHASYLINIGSPDAELREKSYQALKVEVERAEALGIATITFHPGAHMKAGEEAGLENVAGSLGRLLQETEGAETAVCLETTAGTGTTLGYQFEHLAYLLEHSHSEEHPGRLGVCFDTCHVFASGYDFRTAEAYQETMDEFDSVVGLEHIKCFHLNDSKYDLGKRGDRHDHIGEGLIGLDGFSNFVNDPRWSEHPAHLETPKKEEKDDGEEIEMDSVNLDTLRKLIK
jgi:deoxyribonuclease-4